MQSRMVGDNDMKEQVIEVSGPYCRIWWTWERVAGVIHWRYVRPMLAGPDGRYLGTATTLRIGH